MHKYINLKTALVLVLAFNFSSCDDENEPKSLRPAIDYNLLASDAPYNSLFVDASGNTTVNTFEGNTKYRMFQSINSYMSTSISGKTHIEAAKLKNMFSNT